MDREIKNFLITKVVVQRKKYGKAEEKKKYLKYR